MWHAVPPKKKRHNVDCYPYKARKKERKRGEGFAITEDEGVTIL